MDGHDEQDFGMEKTGSGKCDQVEVGPLKPCALSVVDDALCRLAAMSDMAYSATIAEAHALVQGVLAGMLGLEVLVEGVDHEGLDHSPTASERQPRLV